MGRAARNHGGTGGHGCFPMPGERPNYNLHVMKDKALLSLITNNDSKKLAVSKGSPTQMGQLKPSSEKLPMTALTESQPRSFKEEHCTSKREKISSEQMISSEDQPPLQSIQPKDERFSKQKSGWQTSYKQSLPKVKQPMALVKLPVTSVKQSLTSVKQPETSAQGKESPEQQQTLTLDQPLFTSGKKPVIKVKLQDTQIQPQVTSVQYLVTSTQYPVTTIQQRVTSVPNLVESTGQEQLPTLSQNPKLFTSTEQQLIKAHLPLTKVQNTSTSVNLPGTPDDQQVVSVQPVFNFQHQVTSQESTVHEQQQTLTSDQPLFTSGKKPVIKVKLQDTQIQPQVTSVQYPVTSTQYPVTTKQQRVTSVPNQVTSQESTVHEDQQTLTSDQPLFLSVQKPGVNVNLASNLVKQHVTSDKQSLTLPKATLQSQQSHNLVQKLGNSVQPPVTQAKHSVNPPVTSVEQQMASAQQPFYSMTSKPNPVISFLQVPTDFSTFSLVPIHQLPCSYYWVPAKSYGVASVSSNLTNQRVNYSPQVQANYPHEVQSAKERSLKD